MEDPGKPMNLLQKVWKKWRAFGKAMGAIVAAAFMTLFYFTVAVPFGIGVRLFGDPLGVKRATPGWLAREDKQHTIEDARRLY